MYNFILNMWLMNRINDLKVRSYVPVFIDEKQADTILDTPKFPNY